MSSKKRTLLEFYRLFYNEKRYEEGSQLLAEDFVNHHAGANEKGRAAIVQGFGAAAKHMPDFHIEVKRICEEGADVWAFSLITGLPGSGRAVSVDIWRFDGEQIAEHWDVGQRLTGDQDPSEWMGAERVSTEG